MRVTNENNIDLAVAVWLLQDGYQSGADVAPEGELLSVTTLLKPTKQLILGRQVDRSMESYDVSDMIASRMGHAIHDSIERAWTSGTWKQALRKLNYPEKIIQSIRVNPDPATIKEGEIPVYLEQRGFLEFEDIILTGQLDFSIGGAYRDVKSTSTFSYTSSNKDEDYILQGSLYRMIMPELIQSDIMRILFVFTDWQKFRAKQNADYPQTKAVHKEYKLMSIEDTKKWLSAKLADIRANAGLSQDKMVRCNDKQLWRSDDQYKYYTTQAAADKGGRCARNLPTEAEAIAHVQSKGKGVYIKVPGEVKACEYCPAYPICEQRKEYFSD